MTMKDRIVDTVKGVFPNSKILLLYYSGSTAYGIQNDKSDIDVTVVLEDYKGCMHLNLGFFDAFIFSKENYLKRQTFNECINLYYLASVDDVLDLEASLIYADAEFRIQIDNLISIDSAFICNHLLVVVSYHKMRFDISKTLKSHYHVLRIRGMVEHYKKTGKYELVVEEPWRSKMLDYKKNWNNEIADNYVEEIKDQLDYLNNYRIEMIQSGLG